MTLCFQLPTPNPLFPVSCHSNVTDTTESVIDGTATSVYADGRLGGVDSQRKERVSNAVQQRQMGAEMVAGWLQPPRHRPDEMKWKDTMPQSLPVSPTFSLRRYERADDAAYAAELRSELYGDEYTIVDTGLGFAAVRLADLAAYNIEPWQVLGSRIPGISPDVRRARLNALVLAVTSEPEQVAS